MSQDCIKNGSSAACARPLSCTDVLDPITY